VEEFFIKECSIDDIYKVKFIAEKTFCETFSNDNTKDNIENYLKENFSYDQIKSEINNSYSRFYIV